MKYVFPMLIGALIAWLLCQVLDKPYGLDGEVERDTVVTYDTVRVERPVARDSVVVRYATVRVAVRDTTWVTAQVDAVTDSVEVVMPITQHHYADSLYDAWVSGWAAQLDSIHIYTPVTTITEVRERRPRWGVGITAGVGVTPKGFQPYIGVGVTYNLPIIR